MGDGTETRGHASNSDQGLDTHSRAADHDSGAEYVVDEQVGVVQRGDRHPGDAEAQQTQLPEDTATDKEVKTEEAGAKDKEIKTEKAGATDEKIRTEEAGGKQDGVKDGGNLDSKGADGPEVTTMTKEGKIEDAGDEQVCIKEGGDLYAEDVEGQLAMLPEVTATTEDITIEDIQVGNPGDIDPEEIDRLRKIIWRRRHLLIGKVNALPPAARGAICDIDVGNAKPVAQRVRKVAPQFREKLSQLLKGLLSARIIQNSTSPWASPIVVIIKKNGVDIRLCIDYRLINSLTRLMVYPMPLINDLLDDLDKVLWYCSLDMASGFWVVSMTDRARMISAFITPFELFEWNRMPFGLKNAPQIYQRLIDNALYGFLKITNTQDRQAKNDPNEPNLVDLFKEGEPDEDKPTSVLGRRSYIDDILVTAGSWENLCEKVDKLLDACDEWNLSISVVKSFWGMKKADYLGHRVSADGMEARPKDLSSLANLPFPTTLRSMQSFLGSLNYYSRFIEDFAIYASILYELREADFFEAIRRSKINPDVGLTGDDDSQPSGEDKWARAMTAFTVLKDKLVRAPILRHFDPDRRPVVVVYASKWAISAALMQDHDGVYQPVTFTSRTLKPNEINYGVVDKEVLALLRILDVCYTQLVTRSIKVLTRHSTLAWLVNSSGLQGRLGRWAALLSGWTLEIVKCAKGEDEILGVMAASITPREEVDAILTSIAPRKQPRQAITMLPPTVELDEKLLDVSFDGSARVKSSGGAFSAVVWSLPGWTVISAASKYKPDLTVNEAEYHGMLLCFDLLSDLDRGGSLSAETRTW
ncbi:hypothetical protein PF007_g17052 [Phytophthora fragariae]|uniref:Reverse transcriptase domain-containing protein n=1 Tax=Phytophthora fragariae TaxID=53985 RepID=A0A6A3RM88_9STRA|nr:hypothetical protein PF007_g17052 [Phytophthora fragariae]